MWARTPRGEYVSALSPTLPFPDFPLSAGDHAPERISHRSEAAMGSPIPDLPQIQTHSTPVTTPRFHQINDIPVQGPVRRSTIGYARSRQGGPGPMPRKHLVEPLKTAHFCSYPPSAGPPFAGPSRHAVLAPHSATTLLLPTPPSFTSPASVIAPQPQKTRPRAHKKSDETNPIEILFATPASKNKANQTQFFGFVAWALVPAASTIVSTPRGGAEGSATLRGDASGGGAKSRAEKPRICKKR